MMFLKAFVVGGLICVVGQLLIDLTKLTPARTSLRCRATARLYLRKTNTLAACCGTASPALSWKKM